MFYNETNETNEKQENNEVLDSIEETVVNETENLDDFTDCLKNSIVQAEKQANYIIQDAYILITNQSVRVKKIQKDLNLNGAIVEKNDLRKISKIKIDEDENYHYNFYTSHYKIDDKLITDNPVGLNCNKLSIISLGKMHFTSNMKPLSFI